MSEIAKRLRDRAAERRHVGWELSDAMTPGEMEAAAAEIERKQQQYERSQRYWVEAAQKALAGDTEHLRLRVDMALSGPIQMTETA